MKFPAWIAVSGFMISTLILFLLSIIPTELLSQAPALCLVKNIFGFECPGCGMTRALSSALHGNFLDAMNYNRAVIIILPLWVAGKLTVLLLFVKRAKATAVISPQ